MQIRSSAFNNLDPIPAAHSCDGEGSSPPLEFVDVPERTVSLALICYDPDVPKDRRPDGMFNHWVLFNLSPTTTGISAGGDPGGVRGLNTLGSHVWIPMAPPPGDGLHRYYFTLYALDRTLDLNSDTTKDQLLAAIAGHIVAESQLMGTFDRD